MRTRRGRSNGINIHSRYFQLPRSYRGILSGPSFRVYLDLNMRYVAAYLLAVLGGNTSPSAKDIKAILGSVGIEADDQRLNKVISELNGKDINQVLNAGMSKLACMPAGGAVSVAAPGVSTAAAPGAAPAVEEKKEEKKEESEESDEDMGFGLFD
ncbi:hypothetical protein UPYG_G00001140 [Umbra pygmaea]|uniref:Large ribosomal subunit protein P2 n=1 Tax=Umbra pygmaea TaxID=75934 RepID=A0ABD0Y3S1_UMBPY